MRDQRKGQHGLPATEIREFSGNCRMIGMGGTLVSNGVFVATYIYIEGIPNIYVSGPFFVVGGVLGLAGWAGEASYKKKLNKSTSLQIRLAPEVGGAAVAVKF